ncbi:putative transporter [Mycena venus]|uniref:Putative transporter n=1 Tax=Mycena venus TaxID=2733690 RepID=A0A8H6YFY8_9AGAR|nr:putative transporter [Mycena venus]
MSETQGTTSSVPADIEKYSNEDLPDAHDGRGAALVERTGSAEKETIAGDNAGALIDEDKKFEVGWTDQDPENPMTWSSRRKWTIVALLSWITFLTPLASSMFAPGIPQVLVEFNVPDSDTTTTTFVVSIFVLGFAFGPLIIAPLSELYGRNPIYHVCNLLFSVFTLGCALATSVAMLMAFRFLSGFAGVAVITCGGGSISDMMPAEVRGRAMSLWSLGPLLGPVIGPVCAGFLVEAMGWRWVFWIVLICAGLSTVGAFFVLRETYAPAILEKRAAKLRKETGDERYQSVLKKKDVIPKQVFMRAIVRPLKMLFLQPIITMMCVYISLLYGILYLLFTTFTFVYEEVYGFSSVGAGLSFIASGTGNLLGLFFVGYVSDKIIKRVLASGKTPRPEDRLNLLLTVPATLTLPAGLLMYGWTAYHKVHWIAPMIGTGIMGFGMIVMVMVVTTYLVDAFTAHAASVTAANAVLRSLLGALLPLAGLGLYDAIGLGWGNTLLGLIALVLAPFCPTCGTSILCCEAANGEIISVNVRALADVDPDALSAQLTPCGVADVPSNPDPSSQDELHANCHCGAISICSRDGVLWAYPPKADVTVHTQDSLVEYMFGNKKIVHGFCGICSVHVWEQFLKPEKAHTIGLNVRAINGFDFATLPTRVHDGKARMPQY